MEYSVNRGTYAVTLYIFEFIALLVTTVGDTVHDVQYTRDADQIRRRRPKIIPRCGRARLHGIPTAALRRQTARNLMLDSEMLDISDGRAVYIADKRILIDFADGAKSRPHVTEYDHPIVAIYEDVREYVAMFAHNLFNMIFIQLGHYDSYFINISDLKYLTDGAEIFIHSFGRMFHIAKNARGYISHDEHFVLNNGVRILMRSMHYFESPEIAIAGTTVEMEWICNRRENRVEYISSDERLINNINRMCYARLPELIVTYDGGYVIFSEKNGRTPLVYCQKYEGGNVPTIINGVIVWLGYSYELLCGLIRAGRTTWYNLIPKLEYLVHISKNTIFHNSRDYQIVYYKGEDVIVFTDDYLVYAPRPIVCIPGLCHYSQEMGRIRNVYHLADKSVVFVSGFRGLAYKTQFTFGSVSQTADYNIVLDGITYYHRGGHISDGENNIPVEKFVQFKQIGQMVNGVFTLKYQGKHVAFRDITNWQSEYAIAMIGPNHFIAARIGGGDTIWEGHTIHATPARRSKPALRDVQYDDE